MNDALRVRLLQAIGDLDCDADGFIETQGAGFDHSLKAATFDTFHRDEGLTFRLVDFMDRAYVGVNQGRRRLGLVKEPHFLLLGAHGMRRQELECHGTLELRVLGLVDDAHAAFAELLEDFIAGDCRADHGAIPS
jgi:hypothetical protein